MIVIPGGAFDRCAELETAAMTRPDGQPATAFVSRADALKAMRAETIELRAELDELKEALAGRPF